MPRPTAAQRRASSLAVGREERREQGRDAGRDPRVMTLGEVPVADDRQTVAGRWDAAVGLERRGGGHALFVRAQAPGAFLRLPPLGLSIYNGLL